MKEFLRAWLILAVAALAASVVINISAWLGQTTFESMTWVLHTGVAAIWLPTVWVCYGPLTDGFKIFGRRRDSWSVVLRGCPRWVRNGMYILGGCMLLNMVASAVASAHGANTPMSHTEATLDDLRVTSGFWIFTFYGSAAVLVSMRNLDDQWALGPRRCPRGHETSKEVFYCETCGVRMPDRPERL